MVSRSDNVEHEPKLAGYCKEFRTQPEQCAESIPWDCRVEVIISSIIY